MHVPERLATGCKNINISKGILLVLKPLSLKLLLSIRQSSINNYSILYLCVLY